MDWTIVAGRPVYLQLIEQLELAIITGEYPPGEKIPGVRDLAAQAQVNPNTMQRALAELEARGLLETQRTAGEPSHPTRKNWRRHGSRWPGSWFMIFIVRRRRSASQKPNWPRCLNRRRGNHGGYLHRKPS